MSAQTASESDADDPVKILCVLPARYHEQFLAEYYQAAAEAARKVLSGLPGDAFDALVEGASVLADHDQVHGDSLVEVTAISQVAAGRMPGQQLNGHR